MSNCSRFDRCEFCGQLLLGPHEVISKSGGRPRIYHARCGNVKRLLDWVAFQLPQIDLTVERAAVVRSSLIQISNSLPVVRSANGRFMSKTEGKGSHE